jgi:hypothetical protein
MRIYFSCAGNNGKVIGYVEWGDHMPPFKKWAEDFPATDYRVIPNTCIRHLNIPQNWNGFTLSLSEILK